ncbi:hypothetical protein CANCADRAFT_23040 [Tortispora caseinolytica NRRL Y-17796]|uniref:Carbohydrate kinase FGGY C-terminal domain-containing protein n=1 Tax=Tortispora caseinolytica NRRL Y-17796 TaxID=767744 RepID=A0A1E4TJX8_9ASCO|nr:hypothetical protein CANCADRAFT_23040 [Tortispora caseinolytica NRRL Y-17796]
MFSEEVYYFGIDVGTGSARACLIDRSGEVLGVASKEITKWEPKVSYFNQSSNEIWQACCYCTKKVLEDTGVDPAKVKGIGFDGTCSLVVINEKTDEPMPVGPNWNEPEQNILLWMDHRAGKQTKAVNATNHKLLKYVGGQMSIEMEIPKAKWLKENMPEGMFEQCKFYDLADYLTHRATGSEKRSFCSVVCKQGYIPVGVDGSIKGWSEDFLNSIGLEELVEDNFRRLGGVNGDNGTYLSAGEFVGFLSKESAKELGLTESVAVGSGVIDAYAGWVGTVAAKSDLLVAENSPDVDPHHEDCTFNRLAAVAGTSTCHLVMSPNPIFVPGVWGPYRDVLIPNRWLAEGGQSTTGELLKFVTTTHPAYEELVMKAQNKGVSTFDYLNALLEEMRLHNSAPNIPYVAKHYFFYGDLYGNRSPIADNSMRGNTVGQEMDASLENLALQYYGAIEFIAQQTRHITDSLNKAGHQITSIFLSGGQCRNNLLTWLIASATKMPVVIPRYIDAAVVLGAAMLGAKADMDIKMGVNTKLWDIMSAMSKTGKVVWPTDDKDVRTLLEAKFEIFLDQADRQRKYREAVDKALGEA